MNIFQWLKEHNYEYTWNMELGGRIPDIIGFNENEIIAFEIKSRPEEIAKAIGQCLFYLNKANKAYVILPSKASKTIPEISLEMLKKHGIGLIRINGQISVLLKPKYFYHDNEEIIKKLKEKSLSLSKPYSNVKEDILKILKKHPEGLSIVEIEKILGVSKHTTTRYIYQLFGEGLIHQREVGTAKLCYLKDEKNDRK